MDLFTRFNRKSIDDRQIDTLTGISHGLIADGEIDQSEAEYLFNWLAQSRQSTENPIILNLLSKVEEMLEDRVLDSEESQELLNLFQKFIGEPFEIRELKKTTALPIDDPLPPITLENRSFLFTGTCVYGTKRQCQEAIGLLGGINASGVTKKLTI